MDCLYEEADSKISVCNKLLPRGDRLQKIIARALIALEDLASANLSANNLSPDNLLVYGEKDNFRIKDLGAANSLEDQDVQHLTSHAFYTAPEILLENRVFVPQSDLYSLGVILYATHGLSIIANDTLKEIEFATMVYPYEYYYTYNQLYAAADPLDYKITPDIIVSEKLKGFDSEIYDLARRMISFNAADRPNWKAMYKHTRRKKALFRPPNTCPVKLVSPFRVANREFSKAAYKGLSEIKISIKSSEEGELDSRSLSFQIVYLILKSKNE
ncbi:kinase-like protein [Rozella allomycis CSF55]|uniref:non-specific serine/threonine protein kinase n=1 Tax=Rozella allomycis (strain CSF55) TaxID=988480 RepID=A0A4P9YGI9_ROZAC|nr:kinase-like protein [Rozella allomycis CSF55]